MIEGASELRNIKREERRIKLKLQVAVTDLPQCRRDLAVEVAADVVKAEYEKAYEALARQAQLPGFRPGRVPPGVIKQRFAKEAKDQVVEKLLQPALMEALGSHGLDAVGQAHLDDLSVSEGEPMKFKISLEVAPEFELKKYKGLRVAKRIARVTDEDVDRVVEHFRERAAEFIPVEGRPAQNGDFVSVNLVGKYVEPKEEEDLKADDVQIEIEGEGVHPAFNENLRGVKAGDTREFRVEYPEDFSSPGLAGKTLDFTATVVAVRQKELPELDDDLARDLGEYQDLQDLRHKIRMNLGATAEVQANNRLIENLLRRLLRGYDFDVPLSMVEQQATERVQQLAQELMRNGVSQQTIEAMNWNGPIHEARLRAINDVRLGFIASKIAEAEGIRVTETEVDTEVLKLAAMRGEEPAQLKARLTKENALSSIENTLRYQKVLGVILRHAEITVEEISEDQKTEQAQSEAAEAAEAEDQSQSASRLAEQS